MTERASPTASTSRRSPPHRPHRYADDTHGASAYEDELEASSEDEIALALADAPQSRSQGAHASSSSSSSRLKPPAASTSMSARPNKRSRKHSGRSSPPPAAGDALSTGEQEQEEEDADDGDYACQWGKCADGFTSRKKLVKHLTGESALSSPCIVPVHVHVSLRFMRRRGRNVRTLRSLSLDNLKEPYVASRTKQASCKAHATQTTSCLQRPKRTASCASGSTASGAAKSRRRGTR